MTKINYKTWIAVKPMDGESTLLLSETDLLKLECVKIDNTINTPINKQEYCLIINQKTNIDNDKDSKIYASLKNKSSDFDYDSYLTTEMLERYTFDYNSIADNYKIITPGVAIKSIKIPVRGHIENYENGESELIPDEKIKNFKINTSFEENN